MVLLQSMKPKFWFSAHMHVKFPAVYAHPPDGSQVTKFLALDKVFSPLLTSPPHIRSENIYRCFQTETSCRSWSSRQPKKRHCSPTTPSGSASFSPPNTSPKTTPLPTTSPYLTCIPTGIRSSDFLRLLVQLMNVLQGSNRGECEEDKRGGGGLDGPSELRAISTYVQSKQQRHF